MAKSLSGSDRAGFFHSGGDMRRRRLRLPRNYAKKV